MDLSLLRLASSASADLRYRRAESLLPCGLTQDELNELLGRFTGSTHAAPAGGGPSSGAGAGAAAGVPRAGEGRKASGAVMAADIGGGVRVGSGGPAGGEAPVGDKLADR
ncbi:hypothetical protein C2E21_8409 [Chlorella sorokiniana]|uniref:Uncharacterized protein n=1 Tax=Chlorella sorokiniana TaxID=3076 RepID=A0A2P6TER5_CHLSO|nr:hypothetical protein C2E21_8409 [Chlorella sorokiniana]|eukprot:PRW21138.1 hypothetical protein C2E21_8409 [Chlorella sorokiniana]